MPKQQNKKKLILTTKLPKRKENGKKAKRKFVNVIGLIL